TRREAGAQSQGSRVRDRPAADVAETVRHGMAALHGGSALPTLVHSRLRAAGIRAAVLACMGLFAIPGVASASLNTLASCPTQSVSTPLSQWGDTNDYFQASGGSF